MDNQMVHAIAIGLKNHTQVSYVPAEGLEYRVAKYLAPEKYEYLTDYKPLTPETIVPQS